MGRGKLVFTVALPRAGKSLFANCWVRGPFGVDENGQHPDNVSFNYLSDEITIRRPRAIISGDDFRKAATGHSYIPETEGLVFAMMDVATRALLDRGFDVIVDETCTTPQTLLRYLRIDRGAQPIWINTSLEECLRRAVKDGKPYLVEPIKRMAGQLEVLRANYTELRANLLQYLEMRDQSDVVAV